jgi:hypothetical protein
VIRSALSNTSKLNASESALGAMACQDEKTHKCFGDEGLSKRDPENTGNKQNCGYEAADKLHGE